MDRCGRTALALMLAMFCATPASAQFFSAPTESASGVRVGMTFLPESRTHDLPSETLATYGFQVERFFADQNDGMEIVNELITLMGVDPSTSSMRFFSLSFLLGIRTQGGAGFSAGPTLSSRTVGLMLTGSKTFRSGRLHLPVTLAVAPAPKTGTWVALTTGFSLRRR